MQTVKEILQKLVAIPSVSSLANQALLAEVESILNPGGWSTIHQPYIASDGQEKANMIAIPTRFRDALPNVDLLFVCHTDTVPFRPEWADATSLRETEGMLHGCGSCDVKGSMAGLLAAALQVNPEELPAPIAFAFTAEEEIGCVGATKLAASGSIRAKDVIVCEPTSLRPATAGKGYGLAEIHVHGKEAHSAFPERGVSAIQVAAQLIVAIDALQYAEGRATDERFVPASTTFNVGVLQGGTAKNIVACACKFLVEWRPVPNEDPALGGVTVRALAKQVEARYASCTIEVKVLRSDPGFANSSTSRFGIALSEMLGRPQTGISFGSEATRFAPLAQNVAVMGPGDMETAHSERECVPIAELEEWTEFVKRLMLHGPIA